MQSTVVGGPGPKVLDGHHVLYPGTKHHPERREVSIAGRLQDRGKTVEIVEEGARTAVDVDHGNP